MKTLLRIDASMRTENAYTRQITDYYEKAWLKANPDGNVIRRCLVSEAIPHLTQETFDQFSHAPVSAKENTLSDQLITELKKADHLLIGSPLYNLSLPSSLKAYFDHIVRQAETFDVFDGNYVGLLDHLSATVVTARAGVQSTQYQDDFQQDYLQAILTFIGVKHIDLIAIEATALSRDAAKNSLLNAQSRVDDLLKLPRPITWAGVFTEEEKTSITTIRLAQAIAITNGDAEHYAQLCTDDIQLLIPSHDVVSGRDAFLAAEKILFDNASFAQFIKHPIRVERSGDLAIETGRQSVTMQQANEKGGVFSSQQKYTHVFRKTSEGWRYAVLMSNPS